MGNKARLKTSDADYYIFRDGNLLIKKNDPQYRPLQVNNCKDLQAHLKEVIPLGKQEGKDDFVVELEEACTPGDNYEWVTLRSLIGRVEDTTFNRWSRASQLLNWRTSHQYCGQCGSLTKQHATELASVCTSCSAIYYPRISPCIIVLISRGKEILLGRAAKYKNNMYSTLAGFIEPGESAEIAVHREIAEEVGIRVQNLTYFDSQSWPFPGQLMLGFFAEYASGEIEIDDVEIVDAQWFPISSLPFIPGKGSIAGRLIRTYVDTQRRQ